MTNYIENLASNYKIGDNPIIIDLVLDGGAFNGFYQLGSLKLIKQLEKKRYLKVNKISGVSVGSILGYYYLTDTLDLFEKDFNNIRDYFREHLNVGLYKTYLKKRIKDLSDNIFNNLQEKLYISYYNITCGERIMKNTYKNKKDLIKTIIRSSHLPFISNGDILLKTNNELFIDGLYPYIFNNRDDNAQSKILYITLTTPNNINTLLSTKKEVNIKGRIIEGALDAHKLLFLNKSTNFCSFVNNWSTIDYIKLRFKHILFTSCIYFIILVNKCRNEFDKKYFLRYYYFINNIPLINKCINKCVDVIQPKLLYNIMKNISQNIFKDLLLHYCI
tara:strand:+ start:2115 stop:3110 length:996 start_codon:yes stop_codon:yes gene_type:complete